MEDENRTKEELGRELDTLRQRLADLEGQLLQAQKMESFGRLAGGAAHDFSNMLTPIMSYAGLVARTLPPDSNLQSYLQEIQKAAERAGDLTRQLLAFSRRQIVEPKVLSLNDLILNMDKMLRRLIGEHIELVTLTARDLGLTKVDPGQIEQTLVNLVVNARDAMRDGGKLIIETANVSLDDDYVAQHPETAAGDHVMLSVRDSGIGMTEEVKARVFEPFFTTKEAGKGTGLGLSTCYGIVTQSGGHIAVDSEPGQGSTFEIYLPKAKEAPGLLSSPDAPGLLPKGDETVLLGEDVFEVREVASRVLRDQGYTVLEAANGHEALSVAQEHAGEEIHLLLTDVVMPLMGGRELAERLKHIHPETRVLYLSGYAEDDIIGQCMLEPGTAFMQKPSTTAALARTVRELLDIR